MTKEKPLSEKRKELFEKARGKTKSSNTLLFIDILEKEINKQDALAVKRLKEELKKNFEPLDPYLHNVFNEIMGSFE